ncbi:translation elongation factor Ts [Candidatus Scalindua japonica]|uniref:Translation elongation factor Ts n=1 Tax=Candidatus Scalindua japonica TaxID=1284222 RepID=A0A286TWU5_9BACT|nr:GNAT family N-acetyltransferase [Candidatus Scalindua japonica]GAX60358.1 translation elongation factor Ts [Candidatus Scalindua japonica]
MELVRINDRLAWENVRKDKPEMHGYSFSYNWLNFQARWHSGERITAALVDGRKIYDLFAGIRKDNIIWAGPANAPGGSSSSYHTDLFCKHFGDDRIYLNSYNALPLARDVNYEMVIDLHEIKSVDEYISVNTSENIKRKYRKGVKKNIIVKEGNVSTFFKCYDELVKRKSIRYPFTIDYFHSMIDLLGEEIILRSFYLEDRLMGSSLLMVTPSHIHNYFVLAKTESFIEGFPAVLFVQMIEEALQRNKRWVNCGPSSPWDGSYEFKRRFGARPKEIYSYIIQGKPLEVSSLRLKSWIKRWKGKRHAESAKVQSSNKAVP